jgi:hypothetical protein
MREVTEAYEKSRQARIELETEEKKCAATLKDWQAKIEAAKQAAESMYAQVTEQKQAQIAELDKTITKKQKELDDFIKKFTR